MDSMIAPPSPIGDLLVAEQDTVECTDEGLWQTYVTLRPKYVSAMWIWVVWAWNILWLGIDLIAQAAHTVGSTGLGWRPVVLLIRLTLYSIFLLPGMSKVIVYYFCCPHVMRSIPYGSKGRHKVDLYLPCAAHPAPTSQEADASDSTGDSAAQDTEPTEAGDAGDEAAGRKQGSPVVVFITGGAWMIGYRAWGALLARRLSISGVLVACVDYGNFPLSAQDVGEMLSDVNLGIRWVLDNIQQYGGDPTRVHLVGQSAGGHLAAMALLLQAAAAQHDSRHAPLAPQQQHSTQHRQQQRSEAEEAEQAVADLAAVLQTHARWHPHELAGFVGVSGVYDILGLQTHFGSLGLGPGVVDRLFSVKGRPSMQLLSPLHCLLPLAEVASSAGGGGTEQVRDADSSSQLAGSADCSGNSCSRLSDDDVMQQDCSTGSTSSSHSSSQRAEDLAVSTSCQLAITSPSVHHRHGHALHPHKDQRSAARPCAKPALQHRRQQHQHHLLPAITLLHGAQDRTVPCHVSEAFACALRRAGAALSVHLRVYGSETHTSPLVENPMRGGRDELTDAILAAVVGQGASSGHARLCPERLIRLAAAVCPF